MEAVKIASLEFENVKRVKAVKLQPAENGLTIIGGNNNQGKTSVLDAIAWTLGGNAYKPSMPARDGSTVPPELHVVLSNGLVVERKGKSSSLTVTDPQGMKAGQKLLDSFVEELALNLPKFMNSSNKEKAETILRIIGVGDKLAELEVQEKQAYSKRTTIGQIADQKEKAAKELPYYPTAPETLVSVSELVAKRDYMKSMNDEAERHAQEFEEAKEAYELAKERFELLAQVPVEKPVDLTAIDAEIESADETNGRVSANASRLMALQDAKKYRGQYEELTAKIEQARNAKADLLNAADMPLDGLSVSDGELLYKGQKWDNMSGSDQLKVATAIVRKINPKCGFVLMDKLEQMDMKTLAEFGQWLEQEGLQAIATRVSTGGECQIIIEDGTSVEPEHVATKTWKAGEF